MNLLWHEPGRMAYERFHAVYVQCFCGSICIYIYIYGRVSWYYILSITSQGAPKSTRAHIYIFYSVQNPGRYIYIYIKFVYMPDINKQIAICGGEICALCKNQSSLAFQSGSQCPSQTRLLQRPTPIKYR